MAATKMYPRGRLRDPAASWAEHGLALLYPYEEVPSRSNPDSLFMRRFFLSTDKETGVRWALHVFYRSDEDPDPHDHPWDYDTMPLWSSYLDETWEFSHAGVDEERWRAMGAPSWIRRITNSVVVRPFRWHRRAAEHIHRVRLIVPGRRVVTLVRTGPKRRAWYFYTPRGRVPNEDYHGPERTT